ncbi:MAG: 30S ribosome-binding factor RbfA [Candidatus Paraimprobicoccus trichonymphae]|uniref:Ribosome-binding factor A n=1 Tax=Candidatus Paraimprobicoccus trichonymphae TaxID=3033793 RepID=A0AA48I549_9FIRM|nr:MAG: 30S ribosome-binding factor RbfA [Candidatus Paraimprobicoccus trichonymphae]
MNNHRKEHISENIKRHIFFIIRELNDPRIEDNLINIVKIDIPENLSFSKIYISSLKSLEKAKLVAKILNSTKANGYIKNKIGNKIKLRYIPSIRFVATDSIEYALKISGILDNIN